MIALLLACTNKTDAPVVEDSDPEIIRESSPFLETGLDSGETGETGETGDPTGDLSLAVYPSTAVLGIGGQLDLRVVAEDSTGARWDVEFEGTPADGVLSVEGSVVTALAEGVGVITVLAEGLEVTATYTVEAANTLTVSLVDPSGALLPDARVQVEGVKYVGDDGIVTVPVADGGPVTFTAYTAADGWIPAVVYGAVVREITLPLRATSEEAPPAAVLGGEVELSGAVEADWDELVVAMSGPSLQGHPLFFEGDDLIGEDRTVDFYGADVDLPGNVSVEDIDTTWTSTAYDGSVGAWCFAVPVKIADASSGIATVTEAIQLLSERTEDMRHAWVPGLVAASETPIEQLLEPADPLTDTFVVDLPTAMPEAFYGSEDVLLLSLEEVEEGYALVGVAAGQATQSVSRANLAGFGSHVLAYAEVGGVGTGGSRLLQYLPEDSVVALAPWLEPPSIDSWEGSSRSIEITTDPGHHLVRVHVLGFSGGSRDLWLAGGASPGALPDEGPSMSVGRTIWRVTAVETVEGTFQSALVDGALDSATLESTALSTGLLEEYKTGG